MYDLLRVLSCFYLYRSLPPPPLPTVFLIPFICTSFFTRIKETDLSCRFPCLIFPFLSASVLLRPLGSGGYLSTPPLDDKHIFQLLLIFALFYYILALVWVRFFSLCMRKGSNFLILFAYRSSLLFFYYDSALEPSTKQIGYLNSIS